MKTYTMSELRDILQKHRDWYYGIPGGCRADLRGADLRGAKNIDKLYWNIYTTLRGGISNEKSIKETLG